MSSMPTLTPLLPGLWQPVQRAPMTFAYTFVKVGFSVSHTTSTVWVAAAHPGALGDTVGVSEPAVAVADSAIELPTAVSSGAAERPVIVAQTAVVPLTTTDPDPFPF